MCVLIAMAALISPAWAWDPVGHMLVTQVAYQQLAPGVKDAVDASIARFNEKNDVTYNFVTAGCWMDDVRSSTREYNKWHYIELPYTRDGEPFPVAWQENALWAIRHCSEIISGKRTDPKIDKDMALVMLVHLVGDIHQPLHTTSRNGDAGGNKVDVPNIVDARVEVFPKWKNLHYFWDTSYRRKFENGQVGEVYAEPLYAFENAIEGHNRTLPLIAEQAALLSAKYDPENHPSAGSPVEWVRESHTAGYEQGYQKLPGGEAADPAPLDAAYVDAARALSEQRLMQAAHRLAALLNSLYAPPPAPTPTESPAKPEQVTAPDETAHRAPAAARE